MYSSTLVLPGHSAPLSFTDDTSPILPHRRFKVSIHARVWEASDLDWYFEILAQFKGVTGEIKSQAVLNLFPNLPARSKRAIWHGLSKVPIHIVDPLQYELKQRQTLLQIDSAAADLVSLLRAQAREGHSHAREVVKKFDVLILEQLIRDSPGERLKRRAGRVINPHFDLAGVPDELRSYFPPEAENSPDINQFLRQGLAGPDIKTATTFSSKSASAFAHISDSLDELDVPFFGSALVRFQLSSKLAQVHAFDKGNNVVFEMIKRKRSEIAGLVQGLQWFPSHRPVGELELFDSAESFYGQAADIAAGFARKQYERSGLLGVAQRFEYVLYNGERVTGALLDRIKLES